MKEVVVISGKGGTGKTSITGAFSVLAGKNAIIADCDVDAADMHLLLNPDFGFRKDFYSGQVAKIDNDLCTACGRCAAICRFEAISVQNGKFSIDPVSCEGCGYCSRICLEKAISMDQAKAGVYYISNIKTNSIMVHARLGIGADNSGKLVAKVKNEARKMAAQRKLEIILIDGPPGIGCPVISSLSGATLVVFVTEPTISGFHDLQRVYKLVKKFKIRAACIINKYDLNQKITEEIKTYSNKENIIMLEPLPYDLAFTEAMIHGKTIVDNNWKPISDLVLKSWNKILLTLNS